MKLLHLLYLLILPGLNVYGQTQNKITNFTYNYHQQHGLQGLYLHTDKTTYETNDNIWFTGYQLSTIEGIENTMFVTLEDCNTEKIISSGKFAMHNGIASGSLFIEPAVPAGRYHLLAYTNNQLNNFTNPVFQQNISIIKKPDERFSLLKQNETDKPDKNGDFIIRYKIIQEEPDATINKGNISYLLDNSGRKIGKKNIRVNHSGEFEVTVPQAFSRSINDLHVIMTFGTDTVHFPKKMIRLKDSLSITFYPEGGNLVAGVKTRIAFEAWSSAGKKANRNFSLFRNNTKMYTLSTGPYGMGSFELTPEQGARYTVQQTDNEPVTVIFPAVKSSGLTLSVPHAVTNNTITGSILSDSENGASQLVLHNYKEIFKVTDVTTTSGQTGFSIQTDHVPAGLAFLTLVNSTGDPVAERAVYIKPKNKVIAKITVDSALHHPRAKVNLRIKLQDELGNPVRSVFSMASVYLESYDSTMVTPLPSFYYYGRFAPRMAALSENSFDIPDEKTELLLMTEFGFDYRRAETQNTANQDASFNLSKGLTAKIRYNNKPLKAPLTLMLAKDDSTTGLLLTDSVGTLQLPYETLVSDYGYKVRFTPIPTKQSIHHFSSTVNSDALDSLQQVIANRNACIPDIPVAQEEEKEKEKVITARKGKVLQTVTIASTKKVKGYNGMGRFISDSCNDFVCQYNILNCDNHPFDKRIKAANGTTYLYSEYRGAPLKDVVYICSDAATTLFFAKVDGVWKTRDFYAPDYDKFSPEEVESYSTAFWAPQILTDDQGEATISFFTNDLLGNMVIHIQGIGTAGPVTGKAFYKVVK